MSGAALARAPALRPGLRVILPAMGGLLKPITWFAPMWAFGCGVVASGVPVGGRWPEVLLGILLAGPLVCGTSQAANDWFDRHVDAINEPQRAIPSGRLPGRLGLYVAIVWTFVSLLAGLALGPYAAAATFAGLALAWAYSAPPPRLKLNGWWGNAACGFCYEGLPWVTAAAVMAGGAPSARSVALAALYSLGAHGIMTLNDFKAVDGDRVMGIRSLPVQMGVPRAARFACWSMVVPQFVVVALLAAWGLPVHATLVAALLFGQGRLMPKFLRDPKANAPWYQSFGVLAFVTGMMVAAQGLSLS